MNELSGRAFRIWDRETLKNRRPQITIVGPGFPYMGYANVSSVHKRKSKHRIYVNKLKESISKNWCADSADERGLRMSVLFAMTNSWRHRTRIVSCLRPDAQTTGDPKSGFEICSSMRYRSVILDSRFVACADIVCPLRASHPFLGHSRGASRP